MQAYRKQEIHVEYYSHTDYTPIELTGKCKSVVGGPRKLQEEYVETQKRLFGIKLYTVWIPRSQVVFSEPVKETIYNCENLNNE